MSADKAVLDVGWFCGVYRLQTRIRE